MKNEQIFLSKNYTIIESGISFTLRFNRKDSSASSAEDTIYMKSGWYIFDNNKLLPFEVEGVRNSPKYNAWVEYDETKLNDNVRFRWYTSWVNPKSIESLNSDVYELDAVQFADITDKIDLIISGLFDSSIVYSGDVYNIPAGISKGIFEGTLGTRSVQSNNWFCARGRWSFDISKKKFILIDSNYFNGLGDSLASVVWTDENRSNFQDFFENSLDVGVTLVVEGIFKPF